MPRPALNAPATPYQFHITCSFQSKGNRDQNLDYAFATFLDTHRPKYDWLQQHHYDWNLQITLTDVEYDTGYGSYEVALVLYEEVAAAHYQMRWG